MNRLTILTYYVVGVFEVRDGTSANFIYADSGCSMTISKALWQKETDGCYAGETQWIEFPIH